MEGMGGAGLISGQFSRKFHPSKLNIKKPPGSLENQRLPGGFYLYLVILVILFPQYISKALNRHGKRQENAAAIPEGGEP